MTDRFPPDGTLEVQHGRAAGKTQDDCCLDLWAAVLRQALDDATLTDHDMMATGSKGSNYRANAAIARRLHARLWFEDDSMEPGTLEWICSLFANINPSAVREAVRGR